jgi:hypothetical protein
VAGKIAPAHPADFVYKVIDGKIVLLLFLLLVAYLVMINKHMIWDDASEYAIYGGGCLELHIFIKLQC